MLAERRGSPQPGDAKSAGHEQLLAATERAWTLAEQLVAGQRVAQATMLSIRRKVASRPLSRSGEAADVPVARFSLGPVEVDPLRQSLRADGRRVTLTPTEWRMFLALVRAGGDIVSIAELVDAIWDTATVDRRPEIHVYASRLRAKLGSVDPSGTVSMTTARGEGYRLSVTTV